MVDKFNARELTEGDSTYVKLLIERCKEINNVQASMELLRDPQLRTMVQAVLATMYRVPHTKRRVTKDTLNVTKLLMGFTQDMADELVSRTQAKLEEDSGNSSSNNLFAGDEPSGEWLFDAEEEAQKADQKTDSVEPLSEDTVPGTSEGGDK